MTLLRDLVGWGRVLGASTTVPAPSGARSSTRKKQSTKTHGCSDSPPSTYFSGPKKKCRVRYDKFVDFEPDT